MSIISNTYGMISQTPILVLLAIFGPSLLPRLLGLIANFNLKKSSSSSRPPRSPLPTSLRVFLITHTLYMVYKLIHPPYDLFVSNQLPLTVSNTILRSVFIPSTSNSNNNHSPIRDPEDIHPLIQLLLTRLQNLDNRIMYSRLGHEPLLTCVWCITTYDFLVFALPGILKSYILQGMILGLVSTKHIGGEEGKRRIAYWRSMGVWVLILGCLGELGFKAFWQVSIVNGDSLHLASTIHTLRTLSLLLFPVILLYLPTPPAHHHQPPSSTINSSTLIPIISNIQSTLRLTTLTRKSVAQNEQTREISTSLAEREILIASSVSDNEQIWDVARGIGMTEDHVRDSARDWIKQGWDRMIRVHS